MGHTIDHVESNSGLFLNIGNTGVVRNVGVTDATSGGYQDGSTGGVGILADDNHGLIVNAFTSGVISNDNTASTSFGGLVGTNEGTIERSSSKASVATSFNYLGGLVGSNSGTISQSYATGVVNVGFYGSGGGLVGYNNGRISQSYSAGSGAGAAVVTSRFGLTSCNSVGGLVATNTGTIQQSFSAANVSTYPQTVGAAMGGVVGGGSQSGSSTGTVATDVYWNSDAAGPWGGGPGTTASNGLTTAQMSSAASFKGWHFGQGSDWVMPAGGTHPILRWQLAQPGNASVGAPS